MRASSREMTGRDAIAVSRGWEGLGHQRSAIRSVSIAGRDCAFFSARCRAMAAELAAPVVGVIRCHASADFRLESRSLGRPLRTRSPVAEIHLVLDVLLPATRVAGISAEILAGAANPYNAARTRRVSAAGLRLPQAKLSRNSNHIARGRICRFES